MATGNASDTKVYQKSFQLAMEIIELSKSFPSEEKNSLTDQIRRSTGSVSICLLEAYRKKIYSAHFLLRKLQTVI
jgi:four helix bundle protein